MTGDYAFDSEEGLYVTRLTEEDIKHRFITPAIKLAGWQNTQLFMEMLINDGQIIVQGNRTIRGKRGKADYVLRRATTGKPLAIVEAKDGAHSVSSGLQQAIGYAVKLDAPFAFASNGKGFIEHDFLTGKERELAMDEFPSEEELWQRYVTAKDLDAQAQQVVDEPYFFDQFTGKEPRYYQRVAVDRAVEAIAQGKQRVLLVMATGTGKTFTAFQIIWRLLEAKQVKRVLFLADRNVLVDQTISGDFSPFENRVTKVRNKHLDSSYEVYLSLYQQLASGEPGTEPFRQFKPEFFDLVVVDECHRGSAKDDSQWRAVLDYFSGAVHLGMTATPKETKDISNITYFGEPVYTYSLREGIVDGFLAPYKVLRVGLNTDLEGWRPYDGQTDVDGDEVPDRIYNTKDFDKNIILEERASVVAQYVTSWLHRFGSDSKTIVFCENIDHAERMRKELVNLNADEVRRDHRYVMRITGDNDEGKAQLDNFGDVNESYPTLVTTSKLLTTGVDVKTIKLLVLDQTINSMTEFKQIIGRGTRLAPDHGKEFFTILDFRDSTRLFVDPDFDGEAVVIKDLPVVDIDEGQMPDDFWPDEEDDKSSDEQTQPDEPSSDDGQSEWAGPLDPNDPEQSKKVIRVKGVAVELVVERSHIYDPRTGKLVAESITDFSRKNARNVFPNLVDFVNAWSSSDRKEAIVVELQEQGVLLDALREEAGADAKQLDDFDLIMHVAYDKPPLTRQERAKNVQKKGYLHKYSVECQSVLEALLEKYATLGVRQIESPQILTNDPFAHMGSPAKIIKLFGSKHEYQSAVRDLIDNIYSA